MQDKCGAAACGEVSMFESIKTDRQLNVLQYLTSLSISLVAHAAVLGVLVVLPLTFFNVLHADEFVDILIAPPSTPVALPPPAASSTVLVPSARSSASRCPVGPGWWSARDRIFGTQSSCGWVWR